MFKRSILFMTFAGEELGLFGSSNFVNHPTVPIESVVAMINMDMIGRMSGNKLAILDAGTSPEFKPWLDESNKLLGLTLDSFVVENLSLPDELQKLLDQRIGMNMVGDLNRYTQYQVAQSMPIAAANEGGGAAGIGVGLGAGLTMAQQMMNSMKPAEPQAPAAVAPSPAAGPETKFCQECGKPIPRSSKFCPECGKPLQ